MKDPTQPKFDDQAAVSPAPDRDDTEGHRATVDSDAVDTEGQRMSIVSDDEDDTEGHPL